jgi:hypothetical protein
MHPWKETTEDTEGTEKKREHCPSAGSTAREGCLWNGISVFSVSSVVSFPLPFQG